MYYYITFIIIRCNVAEDEPEASNYGGIPLPRLAGANERG